jgi:O-methyltransferase
MNLKALVKSLPPFRQLVEERDGFMTRLQAAEGQAKAAKERVRELEERDRAACYRHDGMKLYGKNTSFLDDQQFIHAYKTGMNSGHHIGRPKGSQADIHIEWRVHIACWAAKHASRLPGDFVECGVNTGTVSLAVCEFINFNSTGKSFLLFDTFNGIPVDQMSDAEKPIRQEENVTYYSECFELASRNFAPFPKAKLIAGKVPDTLAQVPIERVSYLHLDMNIAAPEVAAIEFFWDKLVTGAVVLLDDYGWLHYEQQYDAMNKFAAEHNVAIATLPTGQGLLIKP